MINSYGNKRVNAWELDLPQHPWLYFKSVHYSAYYTAEKATLEKLQIAQLLHKAHFKERFDLVFFKDKLNPETVQAHIVWFNNEANLAQVLDFVNAEILSKKLGDILKAKLIKDKIVITPKNLILPGSLGFHNALCHLCDNGELNEIDYARICSRNSTLGSRFWIEKLDGSSEKNIGVKKWIKSW